MLLYYTTTSDQWFTLNYTKLFFIRTILAVTRKWSVALRRTVRTVRKSRSSARTFNVRSYLSSNNGLSSLTVFIDGAWVRLGSTFKSCVEPLVDGLVFYFLRRSFHRIRFIMDCRIYNPMATTYLAHFLLLFIAAGLGLWNQWINQVLTYW